MTEKKTNAKKEKIAIAGLGLIGASLALALKDKYYIVGCEPDAQSAGYALLHGIVDEIRPLEEVDGVSHVFVCTPLTVLKQTVIKAYDAVKDGAIITDVGSVKGILCGLKGRIVGGHPMAGTEHSGIAAAKRHLFENAYYCIVPYADTSESDVRSVEDIVRYIKAKPIRLTPEMHDKEAADFSHMPHIAAYALAQTSIKEGIAIAGSGFMDSTRIASSSPAFWTEVFKMNRANVLRSFDEYLDVLHSVRELLGKEDYENLNKLLSSAQSKRKSLDFQTASDSQTAVTIDVKDEIGSIGAVASLLIKSGVNIGNIRILDSREGVGGALKLEFETCRDAAVARRVLTESGYTIA